MKVSDGCVLGDGDKEDMKPDFYGNDESWAESLLVMLETQLPHQL